MHTKVLIMELNEGEIEEKGWFKGLKLLREKNNVKEMTFKNRYLLSY